MKTFKILINFYLTKKSNEGLSKFLHRFWQHSSSVTILLRITNSLSSTSSIIFVTQKLDVTAKNRRKKQIAFLISALKSTLFKKEK